MEKSVGNSSEPNDDNDMRRDTDNSEFNAPKSEPPGSQFQASSPASSAAVTSPFPDQSLSISTANMSPTTMASIGLNTPTSNTGPVGSTSHKTQAAFVNKLYMMVEDQTIQHLISWAPSGDVFSVSNPTEFSKKVLPNYFKHNNWQSFVRQLNMYGFHKVNDMFHANPSSESQAWEFKHQDFRRGQLAALQNIKRKTAKPGSQANQMMKGMPGSSSNLSPTGDPNTADAMRDDRIERLSSQMADMMDRMRQMHDSYSVLYTETVACRMLQSKQTQVITNITNLLASICREDEADTRSLSKRQFDVVLLQAEVAKLGQNDHIPIQQTHSHIQTQPPSHYGRNQMHPNSMSQAHPMPMMGVENTSGLHHGTDSDYRPTAAAAMSHHRSSKIQPSSALAALPEFGFQSYYPSTNYLRVRSPEPGGPNGGGDNGNGGGSQGGADGSRGGGGGRSSGNYRTSSLPPSSQSGSNQYPSQHSGQPQPHRSSHPHSPHSNSSRRSSQSAPSFSFGSDSSILNPSGDVRYKENSIMSPQHQSQQISQRPPSSSSTSSNSSLITDNPATSQTRAPPLPDPPDVDSASENKRRKRN